MPRQSIKQLSEEYIKLAKRANVRLKALEVKAEKEDRPDYLSYSYAYAMKAIEDVRGHGFGRWKQGTKGMTRKEIQNALDDVQYFLSQETSTLKGFKSPDARRAWTISQQPWVKGEFTEEQYTKFFETGGLFDRLIGVVGYKEAFNAGSLIFQNLHKRNEKYTLFEMRQAIDRVQFAKSERLNEELKKKFRRALKI